MPYQTVKGTYDLLPEKMKRFNELETLFRSFLEIYGYSEIKTPVFEYTGVFKKENDTSDMVTKEMYTFSVNEKDSLTLRPEGTPGVIRLIIENKLYGSMELPIKMAYIEEMFRHERPQKGRQRQFTQMGIECIGDKDPLIDAEVIALGYFYIKTIGLEGVKVLINSLGDTESRLNYKKELIDYFTPYKDQLCTDCQSRLLKNPLRILDCKIDHENPVVQNAPKMKLNEVSEEYFNQVKHYLDILGIPYEIDDKLVRGLDYYTDTVFEVVSTNEESGSQATIFGGGRYDDLVKEMGGPQLSGIGFAIGLERLLILAEAEGIFLESEPYLDAYVINLYENNDQAMKVAAMLREEGFITEMDYYHRSLKAQFKSSDRKKARFVIIIGEDEVKNETVTLKDTLTKAQEEVPVKELCERMDQLLEDYYE
ncbi:MAG: histidine--tRNA ligase [Erysipelotrichaceae bacterium]|nr:histidine--tRNA ligase [Erysipelotrichaceae bacterium]